MHRTEGQNNNGGLYSEGPPPTTITADALNSIQEEIANVVEYSGQDLLTAGTDTRTQLLAAILSIAKVYDVVVTSQEAFDSVIERTAANTYQFKSNYKSVYIKAADYLLTLSGGDTYGILYTNAVTHFECENGGAINFGDTAGYLEVNTNNCLLNNVWVKGNGSVSAAVARSFKLNAYNVFFNNCKTSNRYSSVAFIGFDGSSTEAHNKTSKAESCSVFDITTSHATRVIQGFVNIENKKNCIEYNNDGTTNVLVSNDPRPEWTSAQLVGSGLSIAGASYPALAAFNETDVAFTDDSIEELRVYRFNGASWGIVGSGLSIAGTARPGLTALTSNTVAFIDATIEELRTYQFNGSTWSMIGSGLSIAGLEFPALAAFNETDIAFIDATIEELRTYQFNGSTWSMIGSQYSISGITYPALAAFNETDIVFTDDSIEELRVYRFNGASWGAVGSYMSRPTAAPCRIAALNGTDLAAATVSAIYVYRFDWSEWSVVGSGLFLGGAAGTSSITAMASNIIGYIDNSSQSLRTYLIQYALGKLLK